MAIEQKKRGRGITERIETFYTGDDIKDAMKGLTNPSIERDCLEQPEKIARDILTKAGIDRPQAEGPNWKAFGWQAVVKRMGYDDDTEEDFAARALERIDLIRASISSENHVFTARHCYALGMLVMQAHMKFTWEAPALRETKLTEVRKENTRIQNEKRRSEAAERHYEWQVLANEYWKDHPTWTAQNVANEIAKKTDDNANTIRRKITHIK